MNVYHPSSFTAPNISAKSWHQANRILLRKILTEFTHEDILRPQLLFANGPELRDGNYQLPLADAKTRYTFSGRRYQLDHLEIELDSIACWVDDMPREPDAVAFMVALKEELAMPEHLFPIYLEEIVSTLYGRAYWLERKPSLARQLALADYQTVERGMIDGHPVFIANNGRVGFDIQDYHQYAPEIGAHFTPVWIAARKRNTTFAILDGLDAEEFLKSELGTIALRKFEHQMIAAGLSMDDYQLIPVHPWQWNEKISRIFATDLARNDLVYLGPGPDSYQAQQSIRTLFNSTSPERCYIKTALSILNMGFMRGLSPDYMERTPAINQWVDQLVSGDGFLQAKGFRILREVAAVGYHNSHFEQGTRRHSPYRKMLSAVWRESPMSQLNEGERLLTMAALLHRDPHDKPLVVELIRASKLSTREWLSRYLDIYLSPILHCFFAYDLVFMPHGENLILVLENHCPTQIFMKDIGEEVAVLNGSQPLPPETEDIAINLDEDMKINYIFLDIFDGFFRFLVPLLEQNTDLDEQAFWSLVAGVLQRYQSSHPQLSAKFSRYDLFKPDFIRTCLNRIQLKNNQQMIDLDDREKNLQLRGTLNNPIHGFRQDAAKLTPATTEATLNH